MFVQSTADEHGPLNELEIEVAKFSEPKRLISIPSADHFFVDALPALEQTIYEIGSASLA